MPNGSSGVEKYNRKEKKKSTENLNFLAEDRLSELEDILIKIIHFDEHREKGTKKNK